MLRQDRDLIDTLLVDFKMEAILRRKEPTLFHRVLAAPLELLLTVMYESQRPLSTNSSSVDRVKVVCISDTHNTKPPLPAGDVLIHAGDLSHSGTVAELQDQLDWLKAQPHRHKLLIAGNHDYAFQTETTKTKLDCEGLTYLEDTSTTIRVRGRVLHVFGSPWTRRHGSNAFAYPASDKSFWHGKVPLETDILVTHMPPRWHRDLHGRGDASLLAELRRTRPALHVFGHIHAGRGEDELLFDEFERAYEQSSGTCSSLWALLQMCFYALVALLRGHPATRGTRLVNAASVGGWRDQLMRGAIVVDL